MKIGDVVVSNKYGKKIFYKIDKINNGNFELKGLFHRTRLISGNPNKELKVVSREEAVTFAKDVIKTNEEKIKIILKEREETLPKNYITPKLLHIDADENYLDICQSFYKAVGIDSNGYSIDEPMQPERISKLLEKHSPDIVVITGHDIDRDDNNIVEITDYENSIYYVEATKNARVFEPSKQSLIIVAGACQSDYEAIMSAGANFASSPARIMIDVLDPCYVAERIAYTYFTKTITPEEAVRFTTTQTRGIGGIETSGVLHTLNPKINLYQKK